MWNCTVGSGLSFICSISSTQTSTPCLDSDATLSPGFLSVSRNPAQILGCVCFADLLLISFYNLMSLVFLSVKLTHCCVSFCI